MLEINAEATISVCLTCALFYVYVCVCWGGGGACVCAVHSHLPARISSHYGVLSYWRRRRRRRSLANQLTVIALFTTLWHKRRRTESKQTPITVRQEEGNNHVWVLFVIMCFLLYSQMKQEGQWSCVHWEDTSISVKYEHKFCSLTCTVRLVEFNSPVPDLCFGVSSVVLFSFGALILLRVRSFSTNWWESRGS